VHVGTKPCACALKVTNHVVFGSLTLYPPDISGALMLILCLATIHSVVDYLTTNRTKLIVS